VILLLSIYIFTVHNIHLLSRERDAISEEVALIQQRLRQQERVLATGRLAAGVAHEIRNPLNAIQILVQRVEREITPGGEMEGKLHTFTRVMKEELKRLNSIIEEFLEFARSKPPQFQQCDPVKIIKDVCFLEGGVAKSQQITLKEVITDNLEMIWADPEQIKQSLLNVMQNALDATPEDGEITIKTVQDDGWTEFIVEDSGAGMTDEDYEKAFDLYYSTKEQGTGLGLAITQRIIEQHGGVIIMEPGETRGTIVTIRIPTRRADEYSTD
jgi:signal transduction histidine kinase